MGSVGERGLALVDPTVKCSSSQKEQSQLLGLINLASNRDQTSTLRKRVKKKIDPISCERNEVGGSGSNAGFVTFTGGVIGASGVK